MHITTQKLSNDLTMSLSLDQVESFILCCLPARLVSCTTLVISSKVSLSPQLYLQLAERLARQDCRVQALSFYPLQAGRAVLASKLWASYSSEEIEEGIINLFTLVSPRLKRLQAKSNYHETMLNGIFLTEMIDRLLCGQLHLDLLDVSELGDSLAAVPPEKLEKVKKLTMFLGANTDTTDRNIPTTGDSCSEDRQEKVKDETWTNPECVKLDIEE